MTDTMSATVQPAPPPALSGAEGVPGLDAVTPPRQLPTPIWSAAQGRLYMTSDLRAATGLPRTHLDYYLREGLIVPTTRSESGYLLFDEAELTTLRAIIADRAAGVPLRDIRRRLGR